MHMAACGLTIDCRGLCRRYELLHAGGGGLHDPRLDRWRHHHLLVRTRSSTNKGLPHKSLP